GGADPASLIERLVSDTSPLSRQLEPPALDGVIRRCLRGEAETRYASGIELLEALQRAVADTSAVGEAEYLTSTVGWWKFHQWAVATLTIVATVTVGYKKPLIGQAGSWVFIAVLILATITTTLRLHLWFVSQVHPGSLLALRARVLWWLVLCESVLL